VNAAAGAGPARLAKIVATLGPASSAPAVLRALVEAGLDIARLNFSHGSRAWHERAAAAVRAAARRAGRTVALLQDLQGPRIRLGEVPGGACELRPGDAVELLPARVTTAVPSPAAAASRRAGSAGASAGLAAAAATPERGVRVLPVAYPGLVREVRRGERVLVRDGRIELRVAEARGGRLRCEVARGGEVRSRAGVNLPDSRLRVPTLTRKDRADLAFGAQQRVDAVALSFVRSGRDVLAARALLRRLGRESLVVAKIERREAVEDLDAILRAADGVMVARGDLGVELGPESVPLVQKDLIRRATRAHVFSITATQMLESMVSSPTPTRAEVSDVANAVLDGTDAVMLSAETSIGAHPIEAVAALDRIVRIIERASSMALPPEPPPGAPPDDFIFALAGAAVRLAEQSGARALMPFTMSGRTAAMVASYRPAIPILACSPDPDTCRRLAFWRGVDPRRVPAEPDLVRTFAAGIRAALRSRAAAKGDVLVLIGGRALASGGSNTLQLVRAGGAPIAGAGRPA
jgi:pyruvate kinase